MLPGLTAAYRRLVHLDESVLYRELASALVHEDQRLEGVVEVRPWDTCDPQRAPVQGPLARPHHQRGQQHIRLQLRQNGGHELRLGPHGRVNSGGDVEERPLIGTRERIRPPRATAQVLAHELDPGPGTGEVTP